MEKFKVGDSVCTMAPPIRTATKGEEEYIPLVECGKYNYRRGKKEVIVQIYTAQHITPWARVENGGGYFLRDLVKVNGQAHKSNLIKIDYQELPDSLVEVLAIRNFLTCDQLVAKYGEEVLVEYKSNYPYAFRCVDLRNCPEDGFVVITAYKNILHIQCKKYFASSFFSAVKALREAGKRLSKIVKEPKKKKLEQKPTVKTIVI